MIQPSFKSAYRGDARTTMRAQQALDGGQDVCRCLCLLVGEALVYLYTTRCAWEECAVQVGEDKVDVREDTLELRRVRALVRNDDRILRWPVSGEVYIGSIGEL